MATDPIRVIVADDHPLFREGVVHSLTNKTGITVVGQAASGEQALRLTRELLPDVLLLDIAMPGQGGLTTVGQISLACPATKVVMLTVSEHEDDLLAAFKGGARGYLLKGISARELGAAIRAVAGGDVYISAALAGRVLQELTGNRSPDALEELTVREAQILELVAQGLTNREIGRRLSLAEKTVKHYMTNVLGKLHVRSRLEAALLSVKHNSRRD
ncbi:MAG TPA: response regulator transcription factor [Anaerolineales bacterium]